MLHGALLVTLVADIGLVDNVSRCSHDDDDKEQVNVAFDDEENKREIDCETHYRI